MSGRPRRAWAAKVRWRVRGQGQNKGTWRRSSNEVNLLVDEKGLCTQAGDTVRQTRHTHALEGESSRKSKTDRWTEGAPINTSEDSVDREEKRKGGNAKEHKIQAEPPPHGFLALGPLFCRQVYLCRFCSKPAACLLSLCPALQFFAECRQ
ncbi:hypothetical protein H1C71_030515 [Ictidomys tridecemlineatus]|nr:hypothetical protein H1C71_030515 [Ictidomys tridecemlineatus]